MDQYQQLIYNQLVEYDLEINNKIILHSLKENYIIKLTYSTIIENNKENFLVLVKKIDDKYITGIVINILVTKKFQIGDEIIFSKKHIKEISDRSYSVNNELLRMQQIKNNPFTSYFASLNKQFI